MVFKLVESAQQRWRAVNAPHLVALVRAGARFERGCLVERSKVHVSLIRDGQRTVSLIPDVYGCGPPSPSRHAGSGAWLALIGAPTRDCRAWTKRVASELESGARKRRSISWRANSASFRRSRPTGVS